MPLYVTQLCNAFLLCALLIPVLCREAARVGLVDAPDGRKRHVGNVPVVGGLAMFCAVMLTFLMIDGVVVNKSAFFVSLTMLVIVGAADDAVDLSAGLKALAEIVGALIMTVLGGLVVVNLGHIFGPENVSVPITGVPFTVLCVVGLINALNMMDGEDGLASGIALAALFWLLVAALAGGAHTSALILSVFGAALIGFMAYNVRNPWRERALVFMGDSGSMMLGFVLAWFAVDLSQGEHAAITPVTVLWILALPAIDAALVICRRLAHRRSPFSPGVDHLHHVLRRHGASVQKTVALMVGGSALMGGIGMAGFWLKVPEWAMFASFLAIVVAYTVAVGRLLAKAPDAKERRKSQTLRKRVRLGMRHGRHLAVLLHRRPYATRKQA